MSGYSVQIEKLKSALETADAVIIGAGAGLSTSAGLTYDGERFQKHFADFIAKYHFRDMYSAGFYPYATPEEHWAYWSRHIYYNRYEPSVLKLYLDLLELLNSKNYFVITTNVDHQFQLAGFDKKRLFYTQGDYGLWQCSVPCHQATYENETTVRRMIAEQRDMRVPTELLPTCPKCGKPMVMNLRSDDRFVEDAGWRKAQSRYADFLQTYANGNVLFLELGVGGNTPVIIKYPFWKMTYQNPKAVYCCINLGEAVAPKEINEQSICIDADIGQVLNKLE
jgi:NAD-dependent SIR2 family protein deacetylase